jgi:hypothetical protein
MGAVNLGRDRRRDAGRHHRHRPKKSAAATEEADALAGIAQEPADRLSGGHRSRPAKPKKPETDPEKRAGQKKDRHFGELLARRVLKEAAGRWAHVRRREEEETGRKRRRRRRGGAGVGETTEIYFWEEGREGGHVTCGPRLSEPEISRSAGGARG